MTISDKHSIARVKQTLDICKREHYNKKRAAGLYIACRKWLGTWGLIMHRSCYGRNDGCFPSGSPC